jgi:hypothetical protein
VAGEPARYTVTVVLTGDGSGPKWCGGCGRALVTVLDFGEKDSGKRGLR